jgi:hypothetical protein
MGLTNFNSRSGSQSSIHTLFHEKQMALLYGLGEDLVPGYAIEGELRGIVLFEVLQIGLSFLSSLLLAQRSQFARIEMAHPMPTTEILTVKKGLKP